MTYRPSEKNLKADALSRLYSSEACPSPHEPILPPAIITSPIQWSLEDQIAVASRTNLALPGGPEGRLYVPTTLRLSLMNSVHSSPGSGHPGSQQTLLLLHNHYWWPSMTQDVARFVRGCTNCAITKTTLRLPEVKLVPLPIPRRPWSHIGINFTTDILSSDGYQPLPEVILS